MEQQIQNPTPPPPASQLAVPTVVLEKSKPGYFSKLFGGRLNRQNYILGSTFFVLVPTICFTIVIFNILLSPSTFAMSYLDPTNPSQIITPHISIASLLETPSNKLWSGIGIIFTILSLPYILSIQIRRLHDLNKTGWFCLLSLIPFISFLFGIYVTFFPGTVGENKYGTQPLPRINIKEDILRF